MKMNCSASGYLCCHGVPKNLDIQLTTIFCPVCMDKLERDGIVHNVDHPFIKRNWPISPYADSWIKVDYKTSKSQGYSYEGLD